MISFIQFAIYQLVILLSILFSGEVKVDVNAPEEAEAGSTFLVEVTISKDISEGFARLYQEYPPGYTVVAKNSHYGDMTFKEQKVKVIWFKIPTDSVFTVSWMVQVDPSAQGVLELGGTFSYIQDNEPRTVNLPVKKVLIVPAGQLANNQNQVSEGNEDITSLSDPEKTLCFRQIVKDGDDYIVNLLVKKGTIEKDKFAKIQESVPAGYTATYIETKNGIFSFKDNNVKLLWMSLPADQQFVVSYRLIPQTPGMVPELSGTFSYIQNESTKVISIKNVDFMNAGMLADNNQNNNNNNNNNQNNDTNNQNNNNNNNSNQNNNNNNNQNNNNSNQNNNNNNNNNNQNNNNNLNNNQDITPETGIYYKVQIAAARQVSVNPKYYFRQFNINEKVQLEMHEGWRKYTVGKFKVYKEARDHRVNIWESTPIKDAFVAAYNNGTRITVQEALMIANQKWVQ